MSCLTANLLNVAGPFVWTLEYDTNFFLAKVWQDPQVQPIAVVLVILSWIEIIMSLWNIAYHLIKFPTSLYKIKGDPWIYTMYSYVFSDLWQAFLKLMIILIIYTHLSGSAMGFIYFHTTMEGYLAILRLMTILKYENSFAGTYTAVVLYSVGAVFMMLTEDTISKGVITGILAVPADLINLVVTPMLVNRARLEKQLPNPKYTYNMPFVTHLFHLLLAYGHVLLFYVQLIIVCYVSELASAFVILGLFFVNFVFRIFALFVPVPSLGNDLSSDAAALALEEGLGAK